jgi:hypothetical protein
MKLVLKEKDSERIIKTEPFADPDEFRNLAIILNEIVPQAREVRMPILSFLRIPGSKRAFGWFDTFTSTDAAPARTRFAEVYDQAHTISEDIQVFMAKLLLLELAIPKDLAENVSWFCRMIKGCVSSEQGSELDEGKRSMLASAYEKLRIIQELCDEAALRDQLIISQCE